MAKKTEQQKPSPNGKNSKNKKGMLPAFIIIGIVGLCVLPASIIALCGIIPSVATMLTDKSRGRSITVAVLVLNLTGVVYLILQVFMKGMRLDYAIQLLNDPINWLIMWGGAGIGFALVSLIPPIVAQILTTFSELKAQKLKNNMLEIRKIWGEEVKG